MSKKLYFLISFVLALSLASTSYGAYDPCTGVVGNWEDPCDANHDGWDIVPGSVGFVTAEYNDVKGVTLGNQSIKLTVTDGGYQTVWRLRFQNDPNLLQAFFDNDNFLIDVTRLAAEWPESPGPAAYSGVHLIVNASSGLGGIWRELGGQLWWGPGGGDSTLTAEWSYSQFHDGINDGNDSNNPEIDPCSVDYVEFILVSNFDDVNYAQGTYYLDRARLNYLGGQIEPVAWWKFDDPCNIGLDSSGSGFDANIRGGPTWLPGGPYYGSGYLDFDGTDDWGDANYVTAGDINLSGLYTVTAWFRNDGGIGFRDIFAAVNGIGHGIIIELRGTDSPANRIRYLHRSPTSDIGGAGYESVYTTTGGYADGRWHHVAVVREASNSRKIYVDGVVAGLDDANTVTGFAVPLDAVIAVLRPSYLTRFWNGGIDDIRIYNRALSAAEIWGLVITPKAWRPTPAEGEIDVSRTPTLSWLPGLYAADVNGHRVYFDDVRSNVTNRNGCDVNGVVTTDPCYGPLATLDLGKTYYWAVDEVNDPCVWPGDVWNFTVINYTAVDNFEPYADNTALRNVWKVGTTRAIVTLITDPNLVYTGSQSMQFRYSNGSSPFYSEAYADIATLPSGIGSNWSLVKLLRLYFRGKAGNDPNEPMYVKLTDGSSPAITATVFYDGAGTNLAEESWHEWNIPLPAFTGVDMSNVKRITIGLGDKVSSTSWSSYLYFDAIGLYLPSCVFSARSADFAKADYYPFNYLVGLGDCMINGQELEIMANSWLAEDDVIAPTTDPNMAGGLVAHYKMDEGSDIMINDANGNPDHQGTFSATGVSWTTPGVIINGNGTSAVHINAQPGSKISSGTWNPANPDTNALTLSIWARWGGPTTFPQGLISKRDSVGDVNAVMFVFEITPDSMLALRQLAGTDVTSGAGTMLDYINRWTHLATTFDGTTATLYINGVDVNSGPFFFGNNKAATFVIGNSQSAASWDGAPDVFNGDLDEVRIYNRALSAAEIAYLADTTPGDGSLHVPVPSFAELYEGEPEGSRIVNFKDFAFLANMWLEEQLWPR